MEHCSETRSISRAYQLTFAHSLNQTGSNICLVALDIFLDLTNTVMDNYNFILWGCSINFFRATMLIKKANEKPANIWRQISILFLSFLVKRVFFFLNEFKGTFFLWVRIGRVLRSTLLAIVSLGREYYWMGVSGLKFSKVGLWSSCLSKGGYEKGRNGWDI